MCTHQYREPICLKLSIENRNFYVLFNVECHNFYVLYIIKRTLCNIQESEMYLMCTEQYREA